MASRLKAKNLRFWLNVPAGTSSKYAAIIEDGWSAEHPMVIGCEHRHWAYIYDGKRRLMAAPDDLEIPVVFEFPKST